MNKIIITFAAAAYAFVTYAHTHKNHQLDRQTKVVAITILAEARGEGEAGMSPWELALLNALSNASKRQPRSVLRNGSSPAGMVNPLKTSSTSLKLRRLNTQSPSPKTSNH